MAGLTFFFDPLCPWAWRTARWIQEVQRQQNLPVRWRFFSLAIAHDDAADETRLIPLRVVALARQEGGNDAAGAAYAAVAGAIHAGGVKIKEPGVLERIIPEALSKAGLDSTLFQRAIDDPTTLDIIRADHQEAVGNHAAFGVPWLVLEDHTLGFFGPIVDEPPQGQEALDLWDHTAWMISRPYLYELKRERN